MIKIKKIIFVEYMDILAKLLQTKQLTEIIDIGTNPIDGDPLKNWYSRCWTFDF